MVTTTRKSDIPITGEITVAPDKSISHRSIIFASLANGKSKIYNKLYWLTEGGFKDLGEPLIRRTVRKFLNDKYKE